MVSGAAALLLQQRPNLKPDQVKQLLMSTASSMSGAGDIAAGAGQIDIAKAARTKTPIGLQLNLGSTGLGSLEKSRGGSHVYDSVNGVELTGEKDIFGKAWNAPVWSLASRLGTSWNGGTFNGSTWTGSALGAAAYNEQSWTPALWTGRSWAGADWAGRSWAATSWTGRSWAGQTWTGRTWSGRSWAAARWSGEPWQ
jgi:serine protease AprX